MNRPLTIFALSLLLAACSAPKSERMELTDWQLYNTGHWYPATVPSFVHTDLVANGLILNPYYGTNEDSVQWVPYVIWTYRTAVALDKLPEGDSLWLVFNGLAGNALVSIGSPKENREAHDNMFTQYRRLINKEEIRDSLRIYVSFYAVDDSSKEACYGIVLPDRRAFTRIAPYQQGWDWGPNLPTCGIWKPVYITNKGVNGCENGVKRSERTIEFRQEKDSIGQSFTFYKDGKPIFVKGANWIPVHSFPVDNKANRARYRHLLCSAKEAGFNMLRVWGGGIYEHDYFFDLCDSLGIMVWMDFNFSTMLYPDNTEMLESIRDEAEQNISRIAQHPCVVLWCGNNEVKNGWEDWGWQGVYNWTPEQRARLQHGIDTIFGENGILAQAVKTCDPLHRPYITTSPLYGWGHPECVTHGDSHYWGVWWGEEPFEMYAEKTGRFMSEFGFQSYPMLTTLRRICPEDELYIDSPTLRNHQKHPRGVQIIDKAMRQYYGFDSKSLSLDDYCYVSQLLQAWGVGYGIMQHIKQQPHCMGTLYWQLNDCWPVASWSSIDYYGNWKALHYRVRDLFDKHVNLKKWSEYYRVKPKDLKLDKAEYDVRERFDGKGRLVVKIVAKTSLRDVYIDTDPHIDGHFSDNFFDLKKGETKTATFVPVDPKADTRHVKVKVRTLNDLYASRNKKL